MYKKKIIERAVYIRLIVFVYYILYLLYLTVYCRNPGEHHSCQLSILWSYQAIFQGEYRRLLEIAGNVLLFIPIGLLWVPIIRSKRLVALFGVGMSVLIETSQFVTGRGMFVTDDIIHNTVGVLTGILIISGCERTA